MLPVLLNNFRLFKDEFSFFVLLGSIISSFVFPTQNFSAITAVNIRNGVEASQEMPVLLWPSDNIHGMGKQKGSAIFSLVGKFMKRISANDLGKLLYEKKP